MTYDVVFYCFEVFWCLAVVYQLRVRRNEGKRAVDWPWIALVLALNIAGDVERYLHRDEAKGFLWNASILLYVLLRFFGGRGLGRKLGQKLVSGALTAVNAAAFRRQVSEAS